jgi:ABC-type nitrate/sulfonate/bicarbonate transport system permease component
MEPETAAVRKSGSTTRYIVAGVFVLTFVLFTFGPAFIIRTPLYDLIDHNFYRTIRAVARMWLVGTAAGLCVGILFGNFIARISWLARGVARFLRIARWFPFLVWYGVVSLITGAIGEYWYWSYAASTVALTACYKFIVAAALNQTPRERWHHVSRACSFHGLLISLYLVLVAGVELWIGPYPGAIFIGHKVYLILAAVVLLLNWLWHRNFESVSADHGNILLAELKNENLQSLAVAFGVFAACLCLWQLAESLREDTSTFHTSPAFIAGAFVKLMSTNELLNDIGVSSGEIISGIAASGVIGMILILVMDRIGGVKRILDIILQTTQIAPIALLPDVMLKFGAIRRWSIICVAIFAFYPIVRVFYGLRNETFFRRVLLALDAALPYGAAAIIYSEAMYATAGLGFVMVVAGATYQLDKGIVAFLVLIVFVALLSALLRWAAKTRFLTPAPEAQSLPPPASAAA